MPRAPATSRVPPISTSSLRFLFLSSLMFISVLGEALLGRDGTRRGRQGPGTSPWIGRFGGYPESTARGRTLQGRCGERQDHSTGRARVKWSAGGGTRLEPSCAHLTHVST